MNRLNKFLEILKDENLDGFFTSSVPNITYLTDFSGDSSRLLISKSRIILITDGRYVEQARLECPPNVEVFKWIDNKRYAIETYSYLISELNIEKLGIEGNILTVAEYDNLIKSTAYKLIKTSALVERIRKQKDPGEIENLKVACTISDKALESTLPYIKEGITELELVAQLEYQLKMNGAENLSFDSMVLSGSRTSLLHGKPRYKKIMRGDLILFDFGALYKGYHADISRTFILGAASNEQKELYFIIQKTQEEAVSALKAGVTSKELDSIVRMNIPEKYLEHYYPGLGHGVGLEIHEAPFLGRDYESQVEENMVVTIEPGIYIPSWGGIRIEDTVWVTHKDAVCLSTFPRDLMIL